MRLRPRWLVAIATVLAVIAATGYVGWHGYHLWQDYQAGEVFDAAAGDITLIATPKHPNGGLVVYAHGSGGRADSIRGRRCGQLSADLMNAGYVVAAADADGNAWGNPSSVQDYVNLIAQVEREQPITDVYVIGESMGGLPSLQLLDRVPNVRAWVGIFPVTDSRTIMGVPTLKAGFTAAYVGDPQGVSLVSPVAVRNTKVPMLIFASPDDRTVPKSQNADAFAAAMRAKGADISVVSTRGDHGDPSNFDSPRILGFFAAHPPAQRPDGPGTDLTTAPSSTTLMPAPLKTG